MCYIWERLNPIELLCTYVRVLASSLIASSLVVSKQVATKQQQTTNKYTWQCEVN